MEKTSAPRWWDWASIGLLFILLETIASRLVATTWTPFLYLTQTATYIAYVVGTSLGYSRFSRRVSQWLSVFYMLIMLPLQWTLAIDQDTSLEEQLTSVAGRLYFSTSDFFAQRPVEDPLFFVAIMTVLFWAISLWAGFTLVRNQNYLGAVLPSAIGMIIIQNYDHSNAGRLWFLAFFAFIALLVLGRLHFLQNRKSWRERRIFLSPDNSIELTSSMAIAAGLIIIVSWSIPASLSSWNSAVRSCDKLTRPWREFTQGMESAVSALESPSGGKRGEFFGSELPLGRGFPLSDVVMFEVETPELPSEERPPRYYWRGRTYDYFVNGEWFTTGTQRDEYAPSVVNPFNLDTQDKAPAHFVFNTGDSVFSLLYSPSQPIWVSRSGVTFSQPADTGRDVIAWHAFPALRSGETYQVDAALNNPNLQQLREAGTDYPAWVTQKYLQLPQSFPSRVKQLAEEITVDAETSFDKTTAITQYLRNNIEYASTVPKAPRNKDTLEWILFEYKKGYCVYYASAEILMLRSIGIPARMAVGFAQGERDGDNYIVRKLNAHAWPEVYFPNIGWVEFEPTGNQPSLDRPLPPRDPLEPSLTNPFDDLRNEDNEFAGREQDVEGVTPVVEVDTPISPILYLIPLFMTAAILTFFINRRYPLAINVPVLVRASMERTGIEVPKWIIHWEYWGKLSPIEKAFESINFGLRTLDAAVPIHTTPVERAKRLTGILPQMSEQIKILLDEHQTSLYTSRVANVIQARRVAFSIRKQVILERFRYLFVGKPLGN
ncbi:MAG: transglutaminase-like domain-containing protein [Chloroflexota bacterium]